MDGLCDQLKELGLHSRRLHSKVYEHVQGLCPNKHKAAVKFMQAHPEMVSKLIRRFPDHPDVLTWEKADKDARTTLKRTAEAITKSLDTEYFLFEDMVIFQDQTLRLLGDLNQRMVYVKLSDGPNEIVAEWMDLLCNLVTLHLLACRMPQKAILQVYTAAYSAVNGSDPPHRQQIVNFIHAFSSNPAARLQSEFTHYGPRLRQIMGNFVWPVLSKFPSSLEASRQGMFKVEGMQYIGASPLNPRLQPDRAFLVHIPDFHKWVLCSCLICPGILGAEEIRSALITVLLSKMKMNLFHEQCINIHLLFEHAVRPALEQIYKSLSKGIKDKDRKAELKGSIRELVDTSRVLWERNGQQRRKANHIALIRECRLLCAWVQENPDQISQHLSFLLGFLSITRSEILSFFHEIGGSLKESDAPDLIKANQHPPSTNYDSKAVDPMVVALLDEHVKLQSLLLSYRSATRDSILKSLKAQFQNEILPELAQHLQTVKLQGESADYLANLLNGAVQLIQSMPDDIPKSSSSLWAWNDYSEFEDLWRGILMAMMDRQSAAVGSVLQEKESSKWFTTLKKVGVQCKQIGNLVNSIALHSSLQELFYYRSQIQSLLRQSLDIPNIVDANPMSMLHVFSQFLRNDPGSGDPFRPRTQSKFTTLAEQSSKDVINLVIENIKKLIVNCLRTMGKDNCVKSELLSSFDLTAATDSDFWQSMVELGTFDVHWRKLCRLVTFFSSSGEIQVTGRLKFYPELYITDAISGTYRAALTRQVFRGAFLQPPSALEEEHSKFIQLAQTLQAYTPFDILSPLLHVRASLVGVSSANISGGPPLVPSIADWYTSNFIRDERNLGIMFSPGNRCFISLIPNEEATIVTACGKMSELRAYISVFGTEFVRKMESDWRVEVISTLGQLEDDMRSNGALLEDLSRTTNQIPSSAYHSLASQIKNLKGVIRTISKLSRVLALRQVLSEAYCSILDDVTDGQYKEKAGLRESWRLNNLGLPGPGYGADASPSTADPAVVETLADMSQDWPTKNYLQLPTLLACTLCSLSWTVAPFDPEARMFHNGMHHLTFCTKALAIGLDEATRSGYGTSSDAASSAPGFLECFATAAASVIHNKSESVSVMSARYILMDTLCCRQLSGDDLERIGFPKTRTRTAYESSVIKTSIGA